MIAFVLDSIAIIIMCFVLYQHDKELKSVHNALDHQHKVNEALAETIEAFISCFTEKKPKKKTTKKTTKGDK